MRRYIRKIKNNNSQLNKLSLVKLSAKFPWDDAKLEIARMMSTGIHTQREIANIAGVHEQVISRWKQHPEFMQKVNEFTLQGELATKAGRFCQVFGCWGSFERLSKFGCSERALELN